PPRPERRRPCQGPPPPARCACARPWRSRQHGENRDRARRPGLGAICVRVGLRRTVVLILPPLTIASGGLPSRENRSHGVRPLRLAKSLVELVMIRGGFAPGEAPKCIC